MDEVKEWIRVRHTGKGTYVTCTLAVGRLSASWSVRTYSRSVKAGVDEARSEATRALEAVLRAVEKE